MKHIIWLAGIISIVLAGTSATAFDFTKGVHGMPWASSISQYGHLTEIHETDHAAYYVNSNMLYQVSNQPVPDVIYGFYQQQFFAVFIKMRSPDQFYQTKQRFTAKLGQPKITSNAATKESVYRWKAGDAKIKLKMNDTTKAIKLAIYHIPLSSKVNQARMEQQSFDMLDTMPSKPSKATPSAPLFK